MGCGQPICELKSASNSLFFCVLFCIILQGTNLEAQPSGRLISALFYAILLVYGLRGTGVTIQTCLIRDLGGVS